MPGFRWRNPLRGREALTQTDALHAGGAALHHLRQETGAFPGDILPAAPLAGGAVMLPLCLLPGWLAPIATNRENSARRAQSRRIGSERTRCSEGFQG